MKEINLDPRQGIISPSDTILPSVSKANSNLPIFFIIGGVLILGALLFNSLEARRREIYATNLKPIPSNSQASTQQFELFIPEDNFKYEEVVSTPSWEVQPPPKDSYNIVEPKPNKIVQAPMPQPMPMLQVPQPIPAPPQNIYNNPLNFTPNQPTPLVNNTRNSNDPALIYDREQGGVSGNASNKVVENNPNDSPSAYNEAAIRASRIYNKTTIITQGTLIPAVLETAIDSTRAGTVRAIVTRDVRGFDGRKVLIQRGSQLIGEYRTDVSPGQKRALIIWTRLIRPDAVSIALASPSSDKMGNAGVSAKVDNHFLERFGSAFLNSVFQIGSSLVAKKNNTSIIIATSNASQALSPQSNGNNQVQPTLRVKQGAIINIMVAKDLDFTGFGDVQK